MNTDSMLTPPSWLSDILSSGDRPTGRPYVTLTFAQSIDAKIGVANGTQLMLSCQESIVMTHWMRTMHDAILIGIGTAINDDPQLNVRHLPKATTGDQHHVPRPVILDKNLSMRPTCKLLRNFQAGSGRRPWVMYAVGDTTSPHELLELELRRKNLETAGAQTIKTNIGEDGHIPLPAVFQKLQENGIRSLMVEGGAKVIQSFMSSRDVDLVVITAAPVFVGARGVGYSPGDHAPHYQVVYKVNVGQDTVLVLRATPP